MAPTAVLEPEAFANALPETGAVMALDLGTKTIGVAVCDILRTVASPLDTLKKRRFSEDIAALRQIAEDRDIVGIVVGLPLNMDGSVGPRAQSATAFARNLALTIDLPVVLWDERLSTVAAERALLEMDIGRAKRADRIDAMAAAVILDGLLARLRHHASD